jgi:tetratricopeptide (TPR) repeat protein
MFFSAKISGNDKIRIYNAYITNDMVTWKTVIDRLQKQEKKSDELRLSLVNYQYGYIGWCIGMEKEKEADNYISLAWKNLAVLEKNNYNLSMVYAYKAALYGYEIGLSIIRAPFIGPKSIKSAEQAVKLDPGNPFAYLQLGNIQYYIPAIFGGSVKEAIRYFLKAKTNMEKSKDALLQDWNYLHLLTIIAQAYADEGDYASAKAYYETILKIEPQFKWIKDELYPEVLHQFKN